MLEKREPLQDMDRQPVFVYRLVEGGIEDG